MKKKLLLIIAMMAILACLLALSASAENALKPQTSNAYGDLSFFDESISVGRTNTKNGFTPYIDAEGTTYARVVVGDGTTFYTFPTAYILSEGTVYGSSGKNIYVPDFASLNSAMQAATGTNPNWSKTNVYRIELPYTVNRLNAGSQNFGSYSNVIEITLQPNSAMQDQNSTMIFWKCANLEKINNLETFTFRNGCLGGSFQGCVKLTDIIIGVSPEVTKTGDNTFQGCTALKNVNFAEAFPNLQNIGGSSVFSGCTSLTSISLPSTLKTIGNFSFSGCSALKTIISSGINQEGAVIIPEGVTSIGQEAFYNCDSVKYLSLPSTITYLGPSIIRDSSGLEFVDFNENANAIDLNNWGHFSGCSSLKAVSLPDGIKIINNRFMTSCTSLKAVYLPENLEQMNTNGNGQGPFCFSNQMYFVQEPFEVRDENGYFYGNSFVMPTKPEYYFMPDKLSKAGGNVSSGTWFRDCAALNNIIVMPESFTESTVVQMFRGIASSSQRKSVVYLGKITNYAWSEMNKYIDFVFANSGNTDLSTLTFTSFYNRNNENCYFYFCKTGYRYTMGKASVEEIAATKVENTYLHISNPKTAVVTPADCINARKEVQQCFCGADMGEKTIGSALGHNHVIGEGATVLDIVYENGYFGAGYKVVKCERCAVEDKTQTIGALFTGLNYSAKEDNKESFGLYVEYSVNQATIAEYEAALNKKVSYGVVAIMQDKVTGTGPLKVDGTVADGVENVVAANVTSTALNKVTLIITGSRSSWTDDKIKDKSIYILGYATNGTSLEYLGESSGASASRDDITSVKSLAIESSYTEYVPVSKENE